MFGGRAEVQTKNIPYRFIGGQTHFSTYWVCQNEFDPQWADIECFLLKPPHDLQTCTKNLPKHERCCKQNNQLPTKSHDELDDNSNMFDVF